MTTAPETTEDEVALDSSENWEIPNIPSAENSENSQIAKNPSDGTDARNPEIPEISRPDDEPDDATFPREYVEKLRAENARYRARAASAEVTAQRLHTELVRATNRLADPSDLPFDSEHLDDPDLLDAAITELLDAKPHLASRRPIGDIGQGNRGSAPESAGLLSILRGLT
jgi:hypothetical protein